MSSIGKIEKKTNTRYLNFYEMEAHSLPVLVCILLSDQL